MGCLLAEFKLTAMLFGGGRRERQGGRGGGAVGLVAAAFWGLSPLHSPALLPHSHFSQESWEGKATKKHAVCCRVEVELSGGRPNALLENMLSCETE